MKLVDKYMCHTDACTLYYKVQDYKARRRGFKP